MSDKKNYYEILKVSPLASLSTIKKSYRKLAQIHHPDKNPNDPKAEDIFKAINEAYEVLSDTFKRKDFDRQIKKEKEKKIKATPSYRYDSFHTPFEGQMEGGRTTPFAYPSQSSHFPPTPHGMGQKDFPPKEKDFVFLKNLKNYFKKPVPDQVSATVEVSLEEAAQGCEKTILQQIHHKGTLQTKSFTVPIPPGTEEKQKIKLSPNNLYVSVAYKKHSLFKKEDNNILMNLPIPFTKALLGGRIEIPTLNGKVSFNLPAGIHAGHIIQLKKQGFPSVTNPKKKGNMLITLLIDVPSNLSEEEKIEIKKWQNKNLLCPKVAEFDIKAKLLLKKRQK